MHAMPPGTVAAVVIVVAAAVFILITPGAGEHRRRREPYHGPRVQSVIGFVFAIPGDHVNAVGTNLGHGHSADSSQTDKDFLTGPFPRRYNITADRVYRFRVAVESAVNGLEGGVHEEKQDDATLLDLRAAKGRRGYAAGDVLSAPVIGHGGSADFFVTGLKAGTVYEVRASVDGSLPVSLSIQRLNRESVLQQQSPLWRRLLDTESLRFVGAAAPAVLSNLKEKRGIPYEQQHHSSEIRDTDEVAMPVLVRISVELMGRLPTGHISTRLSGSGKDLARQPIPVSVVVETLVLRGSVPVSVLPVGVLLLVLLFISCFFFMPLIETWAADVVDSMPSGGGFYND